MRMHIPALVALSVSGFAQAASIDEVKTGGQPIHSVETISCHTCTQEAVKKVVPKVELAPGTQKIEIRTVNGVKKIYRTEAWLGGSPVVFVSKAPQTAADSQAAEKVDGPSAEDAVLARTGETPATQPESLDANMIDESATTSAVSADMGAATKAEPKKATFDASKLELRLD